MDKNSSHGLAGIFLRAATAPTFGDVRVARPASDHAVAVCQMECTECRIVTPHELLHGRWSCVCCGTLTQ